MELLYIWIEDYKNIKRQGFNFSAQYRFEFDYQLDEKGETVTGGELKVTKNPNYIKNFFGENITNVTAIVGENGSGKSSVLEVIEEIGLTRIRDICFLFVVKNRGIFDIYTHPKLKIKFPSIFNLKIFEKQSKSDGTFVQYLLEIPPNTHFISYSHVLDIKSKINQTSNFNFSNISSWAIIQEVIKGKKDYEKKEKSGVSNFIYSNPKIFLPFASLDSLWLTLELSDKVDEYSLKINDIIEEKRNLLNTYISKIAKIQADFISYLSILTVPKEIFEFAFLLLTFFKLFKEFIEYGGTYYDGKFDDLISKLEVKNFISDFKDFISSNLKSPIISEINNVRLLIEQIKFTEEEGFFYFRADKKETFDSNLQQTSSINIQLGIKYNT